MMNQAAHGNDKDAWSSAGEGGSAAAMSRSTVANFQDGVHERHVMNVSRRTLAPTCGVVATAQALRQRVAGS
jgi:hypothetical protein